MDKEKIEELLQSAEMALAGVRSEMAKESQEESSNENTVGVTEVNPKVKVGRGKDRGLVDDKLDVSGQEVIAFSRGSRGHDE